MGKGKSRVYNPKSKRQFLNKNSKLSSTNDYGENNKPEIYYGNVNDNRVPNEENFTEKLTGFGHKFGPIIAVLIPVVSVVFFCGKY